MPSEFGFEPCSPRYVPFLVLGPFNTNCAHSGPFLAIFGPFRTYLGVGGQQRVVGYEEIKAHVECTNGFPSLVHFDWVSGPIWAKKGCFGAQNAQFWEGTSQLGAPGEFLAQNLDLARAPPRV